MTAKELYATAESLLWLDFKADPRKALETMAETARFGDFLVARVIWRESDRAIRREITAKVDAVMGKDWLATRTPRVRFCLFVEVLRYMREKRTRRRSPKGGTVVNGRRYRPGAYMPTQAPSFA